MRPIQTPKTFGNAIRGARIEQGLSQAQLAARAGVGRPWLSELENGKRTAELGRALLVLAALDLAITLTPAPKPGEGSIDLGQLLGEGPG